MSYTPELKYDGVNDAEQILETTMCRKNWSVDVRDELAAKLSAIAHAAVTRRIKGGCVFPRPKKTEQ